MFQHPEAAGLSSGTFIQQELPGSEKSLLPDSDRTYDSAGHGGMEEGVGESREKQGAETPEDAGIHERNPTQGNTGGEGRKNPDTVFIKESRKGGGEEENGTGEQEAEKGHRDFMCQKELA